MKTMIIPIILFVIWIGAMPIFYHYEKKNFNNGKCKCGGDWRYFDTDSQGGDGYMCTKCGKVIWQSWYKPKEIDQ